MGVQAQPSAASYASIWPARLAAVAAVTLFAGWLHYAWHRISKQLAEQASFVNDVCYNATTKATHTEIKELCKAKQDEYDTPLQARLFAMSWKDLRDCVPLENWMIGLFVFACLYAFVHYVVMALAHRVVHGPIERPTAYGGSPSPAFSMAPPYDASAYQRRIEMAGEDTKSRDFGPDPAEVD